MAVYSYDAKETTVVVDGRYITAFDEGTMVEWSKDEENFAAKIDAQGAVGVAKRNNTLGTLTINLMQTSPDLAFLKKLANTNKEFAVWVQNKSEKVGATRAMVKKTPDGSFGDELEARSIEIQLFDMVDQ